MMNWLNLSRMTKSRSMLPLMTKMRYWAMFSPNCKSSLSQPIWFSSNLYLLMISALTLLPVLTVSAGPCWILSRKRANAWAAMKSPSMCGQEMIRLFASMKRMALRPKKQPWNIFYKPKIPISQFLRSGFIFTLGVGTNSI